MTQWVENLTLDLGSGHDLMFRELEHRVGLCTDSVGSAWDSLSLSLSLKINKHFLKSLFLKFKIGKSGGNL